MKRFGTVVLGLAIDCLTLGLTVIYIGITNNMSDNFPSLRATFVPKELERKVMPDGTVWFNKNGQWIREPMGKGEPQGVPVQADFIQAGAMPPPQISGLQEPLSDLKSRSTFQPQSPGDVKASNRHGRAIQQLQSAAKVKSASPGGVGIGGSRLVSSGEQWDAPEYDDQGPSRPQFKNLKPR